MPTETLFLRTPRPQYDLPENAELPPSTSNHDNVPQLNGHQPDANYAVPYNGPNYVGYRHQAQYRDNPYHNNLWFDGPPSPAAGEYVHQGRPNVGHASPGNIQHRDYLAAPGPPPVEHHIPPAHDLPNDGVRDRPPLMPDVPESTPSGILATECLKRLANRYLQDPGSHVDTVRVGLSPSRGRLSVTIMLDIDI